MTFVLFKLPTFKIVKFADDTNLGIKVTDDSDTYNSMDTDTDTDNIKI